jgi:hypothetical protein
MISLDIGMHEYLSMPVMPLHTRKKTALIICSSKVREKDDAEIRDVFKDRL